MAPIINAFLVKKREDPDLDCSPATPWTLFIFFTSNYLAHCATVKMYPGSSTVDTVVATALALFLPSSGITRAVHSISRNSWFKKKNPLEKAAMAGALRMVVRNASWRPQEGDCIRSVYLDSDTRGLFASLGAVPEYLPSSSPRQYDSIDPATTDTSAGKGDACPPATSLKQALKRLQPTPPLHPPTFHVRVEGVSDGMRAIEYQLSAPVSSINHTSQEELTLHGYYHLPAGYSWAIVPAEAKISFTTTPPHTAEASQPAPAAFRPRTSSSPTVCSNYNWVQALVGLFQAGSAGLTLYRSKGNQIERYGYAAFGLTVIPYLIMSVINLISQMATAEYPTFYMVSSPEMEEARGRGGVIDGAVGILDVDELDGKAGKGEPLYEAKFTGSGDAARLAVTRRYEDSSIPQVTVTGQWTRDSRVKGAARLRVPEYKTVRLHHYPSGSFRKWSFLYFVLPILLGCFSLLIIGVLTHFEDGESSKTQRAWIMSWLVVGIACGWWADLASGLFVPQRSPDGRIDKCFYVCMFLTGVVLLGVFCAPAIGGFVVVAEMLKDYGICESG